LKGDLFQELDIGFQVSIRNWARAFRESFRE
jgi:hypothetical protein